MKSYILCGRAAGIVEELEEVMKVWGCAILSPSLWHRVWQSGFICWIDAKVIRSSDTLLYLPVSHIFLLQSYHESHSCRFRLGIRVFVSYRS